MASSRSHFRKATRTLLAIFSGLFLALLPGLHDHGPSHDCPECARASRDPGPPRSGPEIDTGPVSPHETGPCVACQFLLTTTLHAVEAAVSPETDHLREALIHVPHVPRGLQSPYRRLPRGPPAS